MITLSSDFGSPYPAAMKGVLLQHTDTRLLDISHDFPRQDVQTAAFWLREILPYVPPAVHLVVVDPGVGTDRAAIVVRAGDHALVGPDNGVLLPAARALVDAQTEPDTARGERTSGDYLGTFRIREGQPSGNNQGRQWPPVPESSTFHGRDVFAPAAARVHELGVGRFEDDPGFEPLNDPVDLQFPDPEIRANGATGEVLVVDGFGTAITNIPGRVVAEVMGTTATVNGESVPVDRAYAAREPGERLLTVGSHGNVELAVNRGRGDEAFAVTSGDRVRLEW